MSNPTEAQTRTELIDPRLAGAQVEFYVREIEKRQSFRPFAFMTNGQQIYFWDVGCVPKGLPCGVEAAALGGSSCR